MQGPEPEPALDKVLPVELSFAEATFIFQTYEHSPLPGPELKRLAAGVQEKLAALDYRPAEPESEPAPDVVE